VLVIEVKVVGVPLPSVVVAPSVPGPVLGPNEQECKLLRKHMFNAFLKKISSEVIRT